MFYILRRIWERDGEGVRLKNENLSQNLIHQQSNHPQHPQQTIHTEKLLKETEDYNNIDYTIMDTSQQIVLDYLLSSEKGEILKRNGEELKKLKIGDKTYNFERGKPISKRLITKFNKIRQTMDYKKYELKEKRGIRWVNLDKNKALAGIQMRYKATTTNEQSAFKGYVNSYAITNIRVRGIKALQYLKYQDLRLKEYLRKHNGMKVMLQVFATLKSKKTNEDVRQVIKSRRYNITNEGEIPNVLNQMASDVEHQAEVMEVSESGLVITQIDKLKFNYDKYNPTRGGKFIPLPKWVSSKRTCINIKNQDEQCFKYSVQCGICKVYEKDHPERVSHYKSLNDELNWDNVNFPSSDVDIDTFEENNGGKVAVNVYFLDPEEGKQSILLYRQSKVSKATHQVSLLKLEDGDDYHYVFIKDYDKIIGSQTNKMKAKKHHCFHCQHGFLTKELLDEHVEKGCMAVEGQQIQMPNEEDIMVFKNHYKKLKAPFVIYADFECLTTRTGRVSTKEVKEYQHHRPCGFMINVVNSIDGSSKPFLQRGKDCMDVFIQKLIEVKNEIMEKMKENKEIIMRADDWRDLKPQRNALYVVKTSKKVIKRLETIVILQVSIGVVPTMIVIYSFQ